MRVQSKLTVFYFSRRRSDFFWNLVLKAILDFRNSWQIVGDAVILLLKSRDQENTTNMFLIMYTLRNLRKRFIWMRTYRYEHKNSSKLEKNDRCSVVGSLWNGDSFTTTHSSQQGVHTLIPTGSSPADPGALGLWRVVRSYMVVRFPLRSPTRNRAGVTVKTQNEAWSACILQSSEISNHIPPAASAGFRESRAVGDFLLAFSPDGPPRACQKLAGGFCTCTIAATVFSDSDTDRSKLATRDKW